MSKLTLKNTIAALLGAHGSTQDTQCQQAACTHELLKAYPDAIIVHDDVLETSDFSSLLDALANAKAPTKLSEASKFLQYFRAMNDAMINAEKLNDTPEMARYVENLKQLVNASPATITPEQRFTESCRVLGLIMDIRLVNLLSQLDKEHHALAKEQCQKKRQAQFDIYRKRMEIEQETDKSESELSAAIPQADPVNSKVNADQRRAEKLLLDKLNALASPVDNMSPIARYEERIVLLSDLIDIRTARLKAEYPDAQSAIDVSQSDYLKMQKAQFKREFEHELAAEQNKNAVTEKAPSRENSALQTDITNMAKLVLTKDTTINELRVQLEKARDNQKEFIDAQCDWEEKKTLLENHIKLLSKDLVAANKELDTKGIEHTQIVRSLKSQIETNDASVNVESYNGTIETLVGEIERLCKEGNISSDVAVRLGLSNRFMQKDINEEKYRVSFGLDDITSLSAQYLELSAGIEVLQKLLRRTKLNEEFSKLLTEVMTQKNQMGTAVQAFIAHFCGSWSEGLDIDTPEYQEHAKLFADEIKRKRADIVGCKLAPQKAQSLDELVQILREDVDYLKRHAKKS